MRKKVAILGSTGSVGLNTLNVIRKLRDKFDIFSLSTNRNLDLLHSQVKEFQPKIICVSNESDIKEVKKWYKNKIVYGIDGLCELVSHPEVDIVVIAIVGSSGLLPLISAIKSKKKIALSNKESIVIGGEIVKKLIKKYKCLLVPVDSEHSAIFQCMKNENKNNISKLIITASGGPFLHKKLVFDNIKVKDALKHPCWKMGKKITIDSATLMNKGLEVIEAHYLFDIPYEQIKVLIHPQSIIHSMVEFIDGSILGLMSEPDMRLSIQYALTYPERYPTEIKKLKLEEIQKLEFFLPDYKRFPCLELAIIAGKTGHTMPAVMNAANEVAVEFFLNKKLKFSSIPKIIERIMNEHKIIKNPDLDQILFADTWARNRAKEIIK
jgi:1-deoxy-D-xylulose-5-phosphate reductoisomerase